MESRENFGSRLGFLLVSAGCAIGIGNVWRFPFITGQYGGAAFVILYLIFLVLMGWPVMTMEFAVGRGAKQSAGKCFGTLAPARTKNRWKHFYIFAIAGNYLLMMYYTSVCGWMLNYMFKMASGRFVGMADDESGEIFNQMLADPKQMVFWMLIACLLGLFIVSRGLQNGVEKVTKPMMLVLFVLMLVLAIRSITLPGGGEGLKFYLVPNFSQWKGSEFLTVVFAAMGQAFFTLSLGIGALTIFGSYIGKGKSLPGESRMVIILDTFVAIMAGLIIFPACSAYDVSVAQGPGLIFVALPKVFAQMAGGRFWGALFFLFMVFASLSTVIAVFENIIAMNMDAFGWSRKKSALINGILLIVLSFPCALGYNVLSFIQPMGSGSTILDFEDFLVSNNILPIGSLIYVLFCTRKSGWGFDRFLQEANSGEGPKFSRRFHFYMTYILPLGIIAILVGGYIQTFAG